MMVLVMDQVWIHTKLREGRHTMSLSTIIQGEIFTVRSYKQYVGFSQVQRYGEPKTQVPLMD